MFAVKSAPARAAAKPVSRALQQRLRVLQGTPIEFVDSPRFRLPEATEMLDSPPAIESPLKLDDLRALRALPAHLMRMCSARLLNAAEERDLFLRMNYHKYRAATLRDSLHDRRPHPELVEEVERLLGEGESLRNRIVQANLRLVIANVKLFVDEHNTFDDLLSEGVMSLLRAVENFDADRGFRFSTYATRAIRRNLYRLLMQRQKERKRFASGSDEEEVFDVADDRDGPPLNEQRWHDLRSTLARMMRRLDPREREIIRARFGLGKQDAAETLQSLAAKLGVCKERVRQLEKRAMAKLQEMASAEKIEEPRDDA